jgi:processing peptidase subunit beta
MILLKSGAKLLHIKSDLAISTVSLWVRAGARFAPGGKEGLPHFFEHLWCTKTKQHTDKQAFQRALAQEGIYRNAVTYPELVYFFHEQPQDKTNISIDFLLESLQSTSVTNADIERERGAITDEIAIRHNNPRAFIWPLLMSALHQGDGLGKSVLGELNALQNISVDDFDIFRDLFYKPHQLIFVVTSNQETKELEEYINAHYHPQGSSDSTKSLPPTRQSNKPKQIVVDTRDGSDQVTLSVSFLTTGENNKDDVVVLDFLASWYLGNTTNSRLFQRMRSEEHLTYGVSGHSTNYSDTGEVNFICSTKREHLQKSLDIIFEEITKLQQGLIDTEDLYGAKMLARAGILKRMLLPREIMFWYGWQVISGTNITTVDDYIARRQAITPTDMERVAKRYFTKENLSTAFIGSVQESDIKINFYN